MIERNETYQRSNSKNKQRGRVRPSQSLRHYYSALARRIEQWSDSRPQKETGGVVSIGVTALTTGAGKDAVSFNLACALSLISQSSALLVESDPRCHRFARQIGKARAPGLVEMLLGVAEANDAVCEMGTANVCLLGWGKKTRHAVGALPFEALSQVIHEELGRYERLVFDLPLANDSTPWQAIIPSLDGVILAVEANRMDPKSIEQFRRQVEGHGVDVIGVVINQN